MPPAVQTGERVTQTISPEASALTRVEADGPPSVDWRALGLGIAIFAALSLWFGLRSEGFLEADACTHYQIARWAFDEPRNFVSVWGRPFCTGLYAVPAVLFGRAGVQVTSCIVAIVIAVVTTLIARRLEFRRPELAGIFVLAQPLVFLHSFSELTELPFALLVTLALYAYQRRALLAMAVLAGLMPLSRPEGFGFILVAAIALALHRRWVWLMVLPLPLMLWNHAGWMLDGYHGAWWSWLPKNWPYANKSMYSAGPIWRFAALLPVLVGPLVFPALIAGVGVMLNDIRLAVPRMMISPSFDWRSLVMKVVIVGLPLGVLFVHSLLYWLGRMASNGELRYLMVATPAWALLMAVGWNWLADQLQWRRFVVTAAGVAAALPLSANLAWGVIPLTASDDWKLAKALTEWYLASDYSQSHPHLLASHGAMYYYADISMSDPERARYWGKTTIARRPPRTLLIWDPVYGLYNSDEKMSVTVAEIKAAGWREIPWPLDTAPPRRAWSEQAWLNSPEPGDTWRIFVSE